LPFPADWQNIDAKGSQELNQMQVKSGVGLLIVLSRIILCSHHAIAGALSPCVGAMSSSNQNFLVISDIQWKAHDAGQPLQARQVTLKVFQKERFINEKDRLVSQATYWDEWPQWSVVITTSHNPAAPVNPCPLSLITDDGEFLVVFDVDTLNPGLWIYRRRDHTGDPVRKGPDHGVFIRDVPLKELWPADKFVGPGIQIETGETRRWFAGGTFEFSADRRQLIHKTRWGNATRIHLADGSVSED
jgi:hypothetical protein